MRSYKKVNVRKVRKVLFLKCLWNCAIILNDFKCSMTHPVAFLPLLKISWLPINIYSRVLISQKEPWNSNPLGEGNWPSYQGARKTYNLGAKKFFLLSLKTALGQHARFYQVNFKPFGVKV